MKLPPIVLILVFLHFLQIFGFMQDDYTIKLQIIHVIRLNHSYTTDFKCGLQWFNRSTRVINCNGHLLKDFTSNVQVDTQIYKFASNEYRLFPIQFPLDLCSELEVDRFGILESFKNSLNFKLQCPFRKGVYSLKNGMVDFSKFPPHLPHGQYMDQIIFSDHNNFVFEVQVEAVVEEIMKKWEN